MRNHLGHLAVGANRHGRFRHHHGIAGQCRADLGRRSHHIGQIGMPVAPPRRRADCDEHGIGTIHGLGQIQREGKPPRGHILGKKVFKARLEDRHLARLQPFDLARILVDTNDLMPEIRKADPGHQADITRSNHRNFHTTLSPQCGCPVPSAPFCRRIVTSL